VGNPTRLLNRTQDLLGFEIMMEVTNECRDALDDWQSNSASNTNISMEDSIPNSPSCTGSLSRRWVWVHHITNSGRIKQIVHEASQLHLGGYVKGGYPGVVVIEGQLKRGSFLVGLRSWKMAWVNLAGFVESSG
jgi:hypothetical protein